ncbi:MAG: hypothetical protein HOV80_05300 [Polyangiaceae bacterium]|nr:hypothetical protein [Polyangiaceae bacterium]
MADAPLAIDATRALVSVAAKLLAAKGQHDLAAIVERSAISIVPGAEEWQVGSRVVEAHRLALEVGADDFVRLRVRERDLEAIRWAIGSAVKSGTTELAELLVVARLPYLEQPWATAYRTAPPAVDDGAPERVLRAAAELAMAYGLARVAGVLERSLLEAFDLPSDELAQRRLVLRMTSRDLVATERDSALAEQLQRCLVHAGTRASVRIVTVELRVRPEAEAT